MTDRIRALCVIIATIVTFAAVFLFMPPITQSQDYHVFADMRTILGVNNGWNVISNLAFVVVGVMGLLWLFAPRAAEKFADQRGKWPYIIFFTAVFFTMIGSAIYHLQPNDATLVWDRLPMALGFMALVCGIIGDRISVRVALILLLPLLVLGACSVLYWQRSGDLRLYGLIQFYPAILIPLLLWVYSKRYSGTRYIAYAGLTYALAKILEAADFQIYNTSRGLISGHTLKHLAAAWAVWWILRMLQQRKLIMFDHGC